MTGLNVNEMTTVAAVSAMRNFMASPTAIGSSSYDASALANDFTVAQQLVNLNSGLAPGTGIPSGYSAPSSLMSALGDILAACVNSTGGTASNTGTNCGKLFSYATPPGGTAPTDTITAMLNIANHPTLQTSNLFALVGSSAPFPTTYTSAPASFGVALTPPAATVTRQFLVEPDDGVSALYTLLNNAQTTIDLTVYGLVDTVFSGDLVAACQRGVTVRVILDQKYEKTVDTPAYNQINAQANCAAIWANPSYTATHEKSFVVDNQTLAMLTLNLETQSYGNTRDFAVISNDAQDVAAFEATFTADFNGTFPFATPTGNDLVWSPTTAQTTFVDLINNATVSLQVENEEMSAPKVVAALQAACTRGVTVQITMTTNSSYATQFQALEASGCGMRVLPNTVHYNYIHAKAILVDYGTTAQKAYLGSINFSTASTVQNRELGEIVSDGAILTRLQSVLASDYAMATAY